MKKSFWFWLCFVLALILATYFATRVVMTSMGIGPTATVKSISISADAANRNLSGVAGAVAVAPGARALSIDLTAMAARIGAVPGIKSVGVRRMPNGNLKIRVRLHNAVALWTNGDAFFPIASDGTIINTPTDIRPKNTVVFRGKLPDDIAQIAKQGTNFANEMEYMEWIENRRWNLVTTGGITVMLPENDVDAALSALDTMNKNNNILSRKITTLDMRDPARILVK